jgi:hypothetical protein
VGRIVRGQHFGFARTVEVIQARQPEAQRAGAQHGLPGVLLGFGERTHGVVGVQHGAHAGFVSTPVSRSMHQSLTVTATSNSQVSQPAK